MTDRDVSRRDGGQAEDGVTIVELLIALVIVLIVFSALAATIIAALGSIRANEARVQAVALANELVEEMATIPWDQLGLDEDEDLILTFGDDEAPAFEGELVVLLAAAADAIPSHQDVFDDRGNRTFNVVRWVTWAEEDDQPELKRIVAEVTSQVDGQEITVRSDGLRAPDVDDLFDLEVSVDVTAAGGAVSIGPQELVVEGEDVFTFENEDLFTVVATVGDTEATVSLRFRDRDGVLRTASGVDVPEGGTDREWDIGLGLYEFRHGRTAFTVFATPAEGDDDEGQIASGTGAFRFYQDLVIRPPRVTQGGTVVGDAEQPVRIDGDGNLCEPLVFDVDVEGMSPSESTPDADGVGGLRLSTDAIVGGASTAGVIVGDRDDGDLQMNLVAERRFGGEYTASVAAWDASLLPELEGEDDFTTVEMQILADRLVPASVDSSFEASDDHTFTLRVEQGCANGE